MHTELVNSSFLEVGSKWTLPVSQQCVLQNHMYISLIYLELRFFSLLSKKTSSRIFMQNNAQHLHSKCLFPNKNNHSHCPICMCHTVSITQLQCAGSNLGISLRYIFIQSSDRLTSLLRYICPGALFHQCFFQFSLLKFYFPFLMYNLPLQIPEYITLCQQEY